MGKSVDGLATLHKYPALMARFWLTLIVAFALAASGTAQAFAANCPMQQAPTVASHACCPDAAKSNQSQQQKQKPDGCVFGMACRAPAAIEPTLAPVRLLSQAIVAPNARVGEPAPPSGPLQQLFRPPRTI